MNPSSRSERHKGWTYARFRRINSFGYEFRNTCWCTHSGTDGVVVVADPSYKTGLKRQNPITLTTRIQGVSFSGRQ